MDNNILRHEENGIELFTLIATGESGMSQRGLARASGKDEKQIRRLVASLRTNKVHRRLKRFAGMDLTLRTDAKKNGKKVIVYTSEFCFAVIKHYAMEGSEIAEMTLDAIGEIGLTSYIQGKTGWLPERYQSSLKARSVLEQLILKDPKKAKRHFDKEWMEAASRITGHDWVGLPMASFIRRAIYDCFPSPLIKRLVDVNPYNSDGQRRQNYHYQHFCPELDDSLLKTHIRDVYNLMCIAQSQKHFWQLMSDRFGEGIQLDLGIES
jgi:hypothetical protein